MRFRFLYLDKNGVETKVDTLDELRRCVEDGRIGEDTLLYDARSREWGPAQVHTAYRSIVEQDGGGATDPEGRADMSGSIALSDVVPDTVGRFLERRAQERREEDERRATALDGLDLVDESTVWQGESEDAPAGAEGVGAGSWDPASEELDEPGLGTERGRPIARPVTVEVNASGGRGRRRRRLVMAGAGVTLVAALLASRGLIMPADAVEAEPRPVVDTGPPPVANPEMEARIREAEGSAFQDMVLAMDSLRGVHDVTGGPREWLTGRYLSSASDYPDVGRYWERYLAYVHDLRDRDEELFRRGFVHRLERTGIGGAVLSMRLARATEEFRDSEPARDSVYDAMQGMAETSLELHRLLVERESDIVYTPVRPGVVTRDPVLEAVPTDPELREVIWDTLDRLFAHMDVVRGGVPGSGDQLGDAALEGIRNTARRYEP